MTNTPHEIPSTRISPELTAEETALKFSNATDNLLVAAHDKKENNLADGRGYLEFSDSSGNRFRRFTDSNFSNGSLTIEAVSPIPDSWNMQYSARQDRNGSSIIREWSVAEPAIKVKKLHSDGHYRPSEETADTLSTSADKLATYAEDLRNGDENAGRRREERKPIDSRNTLKKAAAIVALGGVLFSGYGYAAMHHKNEAETHGVKDKQTSVSIDANELQSTSNTDTVQIDPGELIHGTTIQFPDN